MREREQRDEGMALARGILDQYRVLESPAWQESSLVRALPTERGEQLREDMGELLLLLAGAVARQGQLDRALRLNDLAADCFPPDAVPRALWRQRAELARSAGHAEEARALRERAEKAPATRPATDTCTCSRNTGTGDAFPKPCPCCRKRAAGRATTSRCG